MPAARQARLGYHCPACDRYSHSKLSRLLTLKHAAQRIGITVQTIYNGINRQDLDVVLIDDRPFIRESDLLAFRRTLRKGERHE